MRRERRWLFAGLAALAVVILIARATAQVYVEYQWYASLDATSLWWLKAQNVVILKLASLVLGGAFVFANLYAVRQSVASVVLPRRVGDLEIGEEVSSRYLLAAVAVVSLVLASLLTLPSDDWTALAAARLGVPFGESDPRYQSDLGFWVYWLPLEQALYTRVLVVLVVAIGAVSVVYALTPSLRWDRGVLRVSPYARRHLSVLSGVVLVVLAWSYRLDAFEALIHGSGPGELVSWVDHKVHVPASLAMSVAAVLGGAIVAFSGWAGQTRLAFTAATVVLGLSLILRQAAPAIAVRITRGPAAAEREAPYVATRAAYTRRAFASDRVAMADSGASFSTLDAAAAALPLWDAPTARRAVERTRRLGRGSGTPALIGTVAAPVLALVERPALGDAAGSEPQQWTVVRASANTVGPRGEISGLAGTGLLDDDAVRVLPALVFDSAASYLLLTDSDDRIAAVDAGGTWSRLALALSQQNLRLLAGSNEPARAVLHRDVRDRIERLAPFFVQGQAVTPAVAGDSLYWIMHLYAASATYPVSRPVAAGAPGWRYLRHAAVAVVHAYSGRVVLVPDSEPDAMARTWLDALPDMFASWAAVPAAVRAAVPPPVESGLAQAAAYAEFGPRGGESSLARAIRVPAHDSAALGSRIPLVLLPPNDGTPSVTVPVTDSTGRLAGLVLVLGGGAQRTAWYPVPTDGDDPSVETVLDRLRRTAGVGPVERDERLTAGTERVVPVAGGALYVVPRYAERGDAAPLLTGVATYFDGEYREGRTTVRALATRTSPLDSAAVGTGADSTTSGERARALYDAARAALRDGDWAAFGRAYDALGVELRRGRR